MQYTKGEWRHVNDVMHAYTKAELNQNFVEAGQNKTDTAITSKQKICLFVAAGQKNLRSNTKRHKFCSAKLVVSGRSLGFK